MTIILNKDELTKIVCKYIETLGIKVTPDSVVYESSQVSVYIKELPEKGKEYLQRG